ncbi:NlpC/P60 family protein [Candidatus Pelagibacter bacterium]|nr:NlpC/P60 family protein [Candidatus Pelagibacter bacterium]|tara:strand:- start:137 stop:877 length:741 start_codon:yes stop_codon:yes gene_type:complete
MTKYFTNNFTVINLYKKPSAKSEIVTQMIYGDSFLVSKRSKKWLKIKIKEDGYKGYIKYKKFSNYLKPTHKINLLKSKVYSLPNKRKKVNEISFGSKIKVTDIKGKFYKFYNGWISKNDVKPISFKEKNPFKKISIFKNIKYKWGGKSFKGIDCSALVQVFLNFNNNFCPRDAKDQVRYFKKNMKLNKIKKSDIIYWKGHVAVALSNKKLIHAYGPMKKTVIMSIDQTIKKIEDTANLKVIGIKRL